MIHVERSVVANLDSAVYESVGWSRHIYIYMTHSIAMMVSGSACEVAVTRRLVAVRLR